MGVELLRELLLQNICCCIHREHAVVIVILFHGVAYVAGPVSVRSGKRPLRDQATRMARCDKDRDNARYLRWLQTASRGVNRIPQFDVLACDT